MKRILIFGATSAIAHAFSRLHTNSDTTFFLVARNPKRLEILRQDLIVRGAKSVEVAVADLNDTHKHNQLVKDATDKMKGIDIALIAQGTLSDQKECEKNINIMLEEIQTNFSSPASLLTVLAEAMERQGYGSIAVISSVAGDRGRQSNYVYGSAKGGLSTFVQGLRHRLCMKNINVMVVKPGFVDTPMTADFKKGGFLWAKPEHVAKDIDRSLKKGKVTCYTPWFWKWIMLIIKGIPDPIFQRLRI